jgi:hypothetical protein
VTAIPGYGEAGRFSVPEPGTADARPARDSELPDETCLGQYQRCVVRDLLVVEWLAHRVQYPRSAAVYVGLSSSSSVPPLVGRPSFRIVGS